MYGILTIEIYVQGRLGNTVQPLQEPRLQLPSSDVDDVQDLTHYIVIVVTGSLCVLDH